MNSTSWTINPGQIYTISTSTTTFGPGMVFTWPPGQVAEPEPLDLPPEDIHDHEAVARWLDS